MSIANERVKAGQAIYTRATLTVYDLLVLGVSNRFIWRCPTRRLLALYNENVTANHLDVGVGTGYFLARCRAPSPTPRVVLMDLNPNALEFTARRIARYRPESYRRNVLEPTGSVGDKFDSVGINYLLHCLPGPLGVKSVVFGHLKTLMNPGAVLFGSTLLQGGVERNAGAKRLMALYNERGIFSNRDDDLDGLKRALDERFQDVSIEVVGCAALFPGRARTT